MDPDPHGAKQLDPDAKILNANARPWEEKYQFESHLNDISSGEDELLHHLPRHHVAGHNGDSGELLPHLDMGSTHYTGTT